jgi:hypothetical protein
MKRINYIKVGEKVWIWILISSSHFVGYGTRSMVPYLWHIIKKKSSDKKKHCTLSPIKLLEKKLLKKNSLDKAVFAPMSNNTV